MYVSLCLWRSVIARLSWLRTCVLGAWVGAPHKMLGESDDPILGERVRKLKLWPPQLPKMGQGPHFFPLGYPHPHQCAKFRTFAPRNWGGRIFWKFSNLRTRVRGPKRGMPHGKLVIDIDLVLAPYCQQEARKTTAGVYFSIYCPNSPGGAPKVYQSLLPVSADFARSILAPFRLPPPDSDHAKCIWMDVF